MQDRVRARGRVPQRDQQLGAVRRERVRRFVLDARARPSEPRAGRAPCRVRDETSRVRGRRRLPVNRFSAEEILENPQALATIWADEDVLADFGAYLLEREAYEKLRGLIFSWVGCVRMDRTRDLHPRLVAAEFTSGQAVRGRGARPARRRCGPGELSRTPVLGARSRPTHRRCGRGGRTNVPGDPSRPRRSGAPG